MSANWRVLPGPEPTYVEAAQSPSFDGTGAFSDDLKSFVDTLRRRRWVFLLGFVPALVLAGLWLHYAVPLFMATTTIVLDPRKQMVTNSPEVLTDGDPDSSVVDTQVQLIQSRTVLGRAVDQLVAEGETGFGSPERNALLDLPAAVAARAGFPKDLGPTAAPSPSAARNDLIDGLGDYLEVGRVGLTYALQINFTDDDAERAAKVANAVAAAYLSHQTDVKQQATKDANQWLMGHVSDLKAQVEAAEAAVESYRSRAGLLVAKGSTSTENELTNLDVGLNESRQALSEANARLEGYSSSLARFGPAEAAEVVATPMMQQLRTQYGVLVGQRTQLSPSLGPMHPQMVELTRQIAGLQEQMNAEAQRTVDELRSDVAIAERKVAGLLTIRDQSRTKLAMDNAANVELAELQSNALSLRTLYEGMQTRLQQTTAQETLGQVNAAVVSEAVAPNEPSSPRTNVIWAGAVGVGLALGAFAVLLTQLFDRAVVRAEDLERKTRVPLLALVPKMRAADLNVSGKVVSIDDVVTGKPMSLFTESFRSLRVAVLDAVGTSEPVVIQITSGTFAEGKTVSSIAFARTAAMDGKRVLLIDGDLRRRSLTKTLGLEVKVGLVELLRGRAELSDVIVSGGARRRPHVLPLSANDAGARDLFGTQAFELLLERLKKGFDIIVIDSAPILALAEPISMAKRVDAVVLVARWGKTPLDVVLKALDEVNRVGGRIAGTLLTQVDIKKVTKQAYGRQYYPALMKYYRQ